MIFIQRLQLELCDRPDNDKDLVALDGERHCRLCLFAVPIAGDRGEFGGSRLPFGLGNKAENTAADIARKIVASSARNTPGYA
jgi:hypothetical protein